MRTCGYSYIKKFALPALLLIGMFALSLQWLAPKAALLFTFSVPFLYFIPGFFISRAALSSLDRLETITLSLLLSTALFQFGIFLVEETAKITPARSIAVTITINLLSLLAFLASRHRSTLARLRARFGRKINKRDQKES